MPMEMRIIDFTKIYKFVVENLNVQCVLFFCCDSNCLLDMEKVSRGRVLLFFPDERR